MTSYKVSISFATQQIIPFSLKCWNRTYCFHSFRPYLWTPPEYIAWSLTGRQSVIVQCSALATSIIPKEGKGQTAQSHSRELSSERHLKIILGGDGAQPSESEKKGRSKHGGSMGTGQFFESSEIESSQCSFSNWLEPI